MRLPSFHQTIQNEVPTVRFQCPYCKTILDIDDCQPGELVACGKCGNAVNVPLSKTAPGAIIGDFVVLREIGTGGMGTVFLALRSASTGTSPSRSVVPEKPQPIAGKIRRCFHQPSFFLQQISLKIRLVPQILQNRILYDFLCVCFTGQI